MAKEIGNWNSRRSPNTKRAGAKRSAADLLLPHLSPGETLAWSSFGSGARGGFYVLTTFIWTLGGSAYLAGSIPIHPSSLWLAFVAPFAGYFLARAIFGPFLEVYGITDRRLIILKRFPQYVITPEIHELRLYNWGSTGTIIFERGFGVPASIRRAPHGFYGIQNPIEVGRLIQAQVAPNQFLEVFRRTWAE